MKVNEQKPKNLEPKKEVNATPEVSLDTVKKMIEEATAEFHNKIEQERALYTQEVKTDKASLITVFGIFASITSFLTIEFQFLRTLCNIQQILGFSLVLFSLLLGFSLGLDYLVKSRTDKDIPKPNMIFCMVVALLLFFGIVAISFGNTDLRSKNDTTHKLKSSIQQFNG